MRPVVVVQRAQCARESCAMLGVAIGAVFAVRDTGVGHAAVALALTVGGERTRVLDCTLNKVWMLRHCVPV